MFRLSKLVTGHGQSQRMLTRNRPSPAYPTSSVVSGFAEQVPAGRKGEAGDREREIGKHISP